MSPVIFPLVSTTLKAKSCGMPKLSMSAATLITAEPINVFALKLFSSDKSNLNCKFARAELDILPELPLTKSQKALAPGARVLIKQKYSLIKQRIKLFYLYRF